MADEKQDNQDEEIVAVGPGATESEIPDDEEVRTESDDDKVEERASGSDEDDEERAGHSEEEESGDDRDGLRARRRAARIASRNKRREYQKRDQVELNFLRNRNAELEKQFSAQDVRLTQNEVVTIDGRIAQVDDQIRQAEQIKAEAITKGDGASAAEADRIREQLLAGKNQLVGVKNQAINGARQRQQQARTPQLDPEIRTRVDSWISENNDWFDPKLGNEDSAIAKAVEDSLYREGRLNPRTDAYWNEYNRRLEKRLPHIFEKDSQEDDRDDNRGNRSDERPAKRNGGPRMTTGGRERTLRKNEVYVSAERRKTMEENGLWDDETLRNKYLKQYQKYDREHGGRGRH